MDDFTLDFTLELSVRDWRDGTGSFEAPICENGKSTKGNGNLQVGQDPRSDLEIRLCSWIQFEVDASSN